MLFNLSDILKHSKTRKVSWNSIMENHDIDKKHRNGFECPTVSFQVSFMMCDEYILQGKKCIRTFLSTFLLLMDSHSSLLGLQIRTYLILTLSWIYKNFISFYIDKSSLCHEILHFSSQKLKDVKFYMCLFNYTYFKI